MNRSLSLFLGVLATILFSLAGLVLIPDWHFQELKPETEANGNTYPYERQGTAAHGRQVYIDLGCLYCHSQQVRPANYGADIARNWGTRRSVARDYIFERPPLMGSMRTGPDLANIGVRQPSKDWHYLHLYDPEITTPGSIMPKFRFLFERHERTGALPPGATAIPERYSPTPSYLLPTERGRDLVEYLKSLNQSYDLPEASR